MLLVDGCSFLFSRHRNMYFVAVTRGNSNPALGFEFLYHLKNIFKAYFGEDFDEDTLRDNMTLIYELMDETMDYGYPQNCAIDILRLYINLGSVKAKDADAKEPGQLTSQITGVVDWRREGLRYRKNEVYIDVLESVNLLMSASGASARAKRARPRRALVCWGVVAVRTQARLTVALSPLRRLSAGEVLRNDCTGLVMMKTFLTGMPECKFGLNDKLIMDKEGQNPAKAQTDKKNRSVEVCARCRLPGGDAATAAASASCRTHPLSLSSLAPTAAALLRPGHRAD